ncbi:MAG: hypothetical protein ABI555_01660, partial [Chloroflexota bacterium]
AGSGLLTAVLRFPAGIEITRSWQLSVDPFVIPPLYLVADDGARFQASPGCGLTLTFANAYETRETCNSFGYEPTRAALRVRAYRPLHLDLEGWQITTWYAACGRADQWQGSPDYYDTSTCGSLGGAASDSGSVLTEPAAFILPPGETIVQIRITAVEARGNRFNAPYYARVIAR